MSPTAISTTSPSGDMEEFVLSEMPFSVHHLEDLLAKAHEACAAAEEAFTNLETKQLLHVPDCIIKYSNKVCEEELNYVRKCSADLEDAITAFGGWYHRHHGSLTKERRGQIMNDIKEIKDWVSRH